MPLGQVIEAISPAIPTDIFFATDFFYRFEYFAIEPSQAVLAQYVLHVQNFALNNVFGNSIE